MTRNRPNAQDHFKCLSLMLITSFSPHPPGRESTIDPESLLLHQDAPLIPQDPPLLLYDPPRLSYDPLLLPAGRLVLWVPTPRQGNRHRGGAVKTFVDLFKKDTRAETVGEITKCMKDWDDWRQRWDIRLWMP